MERTVALVSARRPLVMEHPELGQMRLEFLDDGFVIFPAAPNPGGLMALALRDNLGTTYRIRGEHGDGTKFEPAVPTEATFLEIFGPGHSTGRFDLR